LSKQREDRSNIVIIFTQQIYNVDLSCNYYNAWYPTNLVNSNFWQDVYLLALLTEHGSSVMTLTWSGTSITQWLGPTPRRYDVKQLEHVVFICMYSYSCIVTYIHINTDIQTHTWIHTQICTPIHSYVHKHKCEYEYIYTGIYTHLCMYTCLNTYDENVTNTKDSRTEWLLMLSLDYTQ